MSATSRGRCPNRSLSRQILTATVTLCFGLGFGSQCCCRSVFLRWSPGPTSSTVLLLLGCRQPVGDGYERAHFLRERLNSVPLNRDGSHPFLEPGPTATFIQKASSCI